MTTRVPAGTVIISLPSTDTAAFLPSFFTVKASSPTVSVYSQPPETEQVEKTAVSLTSSTPYRCELLGEDDRIVLRQRTAELLPEHRKKIIKPVIFKRAERPLV